MMNLKARGAKFVEETYQECVRDNAPKEVAPTVWRKSHYKICPLMFLGEREFTSGISERAIIVLERDLERYRDVINRWRSNDDFRKDIREAKWYLDRCLTGELPNSFSAERILNLPDLELDWLTSSSMFYFDGLRYMEDLENDTAEEMYLAGHANILFNVARNDYRLKTGQKGKRPLHVSYGKVLEWAECDVEDVFPMPPEFVKEARKISGLLGKVSKIEFIRRKVDFERRVTQYILDRKLLSKLK